MKLNKLIKTTTKKKKRVGRGYGSGKGGHTVGRGSKGQKARSKVGLLFEGTKMRKSLIRRLPMMRGKGRFKARPGPLIVNLKFLNLFKKGDKINIKTLIKKRVVKEKEAEKFGVKILGEGKLEIPLTVELPTSKSAARKIEKAGGKVTLKPPVKAKPKPAKKQK